MIDHAPDLLAIRDQRLRGTCLSFAATAAHEHARLRRRRVPSPDLSVELLFWRCKQLDGSPDQDGTTFDAARDALATPGQCLEAFWPYDGDRDITDVYDPPPTALNAHEMRRASLRPIATHIHAIRHALQEGHSVVAGLELWDAFYDCDSAELGPPTGDLDGAGHALCLVGLDDHRQAIKLRNSWGRHWGEDGYSWLSIDTLPTVLRECWTAHDDLDNQ